MVNHVFRKQSMVTPACLLFAIDSSSSSTSNMEKSAKKRFARSISIRTLDRKPVSFPGLLVAVLKSPFFSLSCTPEKRSMMTGLNAVGNSPPISIWISGLLRAGVEAAKLFLAYADLIEDARDERKVSNVLMRTTQVVVRLAICTYAALSAGEMLCCPGPPGWFWILVLVEIALRAT